MEWSAEMQSVAFHSDWAALVVYKHLFAHSYKVASIPN